MTTSGAALAELAGLNPLFDAERIIAERNARLGIPVRQAGPQITDWEELARLRQIAQRQIDRLREEFWTTPVDVLRHQLNSLDLSLLPDLLAAANKLVLVSTLRSEVQRLSQHPHCRHTILGYIKLALVMPPRDAGIYKERCLRSVAEHENVAAIQQMLKTIRREFPMLYQMEGDWFGQMLAFKQKRYVAPSDSGGGGLGFDWEEGGTILWIILRILIAVLRVLG